MLRWLLWESQGSGSDRTTQGRKSDFTTGTMPALERDRNGAPTTSALALHYAAARGCLDCVKLLVDTSTELR